MIARATLKDWLGVAQSHTADDARYTALEARAVAWLNKMTGRYWGAAGTQTTIVDGNEGSPLYVPGPISSASGVVVAVRSGQSTWDTVDSTLYEWDLLGDAVHRVGAAAWDETAPVEWATGRRNYRVQWPGGFATGAAPAEVQLAVLTLCAVWERNRPTQLAATGERAELTLADMPQTVRDVLTRWRRPAL